MSLKSTALAVLAGAAAVVSAAPQQAPPATEVYLADLAACPACEAFGWVNISNSPGYDNQPSFLPDSSGLLFSSNRDGQQTDIYRYDIAGRKLSQVTATPESEYSPTVTPDGRTFSAVRVEADNTQRLWRFDLDGSNPRVILEGVKPVGYHAWIDDTHLALFVLGSGSAPATLQLADTTTGAATVAATGIGRSILMRPGTGTISYLATAETPRVLKALDPKTGTSAALVAPVEGSQDCAWLPDGRLLMAHGTQVFVWTPGSAGWSPYQRPAEIVAWSDPRTRPADPTNITRLAVSPDGRWLAFVAEPVAK
jgi:dipeptidyl aminopeptidase/acylaminoacyl peptidase